MNLESQYWEGGTAKDSVLDSQLREALVINQCTCSLRGREKVVQSHRGGGDHPGLYSTIIFTWDQPHSSRWNSGSGKEHGPFWDKADLGARGGIWNGWRAPAVSRVEEEKYGGVDWIGFPVCRLVLELDGNHCMLLKVMLQAPSGIQVEGSDACLLSWIEFHNFHLSLFFPNQMQIKLNTISIPGMLTYIWISSMTNVRLKL